MSTAANLSARTKPETQVSFRVRDLLVDAPIRQAAKNQRLISAEQGSSTTGAQRRIEFKKCIDSLNEPFPLGPKFDLEDLLGDSAADEVLAVPKALDDKLELWVNPSGVRMVKLTEWDRSYWAPKNETQ